MATNTITNTRKANLTAEGITLRPGENVMSEEKARKLMANTQAIVWKSLGWIGIKPAAKALTMEDELAAGASDDDAGTADTDAPAPMSAKEAIGFVDAQTEASVLERMLRDETRKTVTAAIERRLEELSPASDASDEGSDDASGDGEG